MKPINITYDMNWYNDNYCFNNWYSIYIYDMLIKYSLKTWNWYYTHVKFYMHWIYVNCLIKCKIINTSTNFLLIENLYLKPALYL